MDEVTVAAHGCWPAVLGGHVTTSTNVDRCLGKITEGQVSSEKFFTELRIVLPSFGDLISRSRIDKGKFHPARGCGGTTESGTTQIRVKKNHGVERS
jgi:hypothetical protein